MAKRWKGYLRARPAGLPTQAELLDLNFWSIVSDGRAILSGQLVPRSWADLSSTWPKATDVDYPSGYQCPSRDRPRSCYWSARDRALFEGQ